MPMLADVVDAVVGVDTRIATPTKSRSPPRTPSRVRTVLDPQRQHRLRPAAGLDRRDHAPALDWSSSIKGGRSYGVGLSRALTAAGLAGRSSPRQPARSTRAREGQVRNAIDAHLAVLAALRLDNDRLPLPGGVRRETGRRCGSCSESALHRRLHRADQPAACPAARQRKRC